MQSRNHIPIPSATHSQWKLAYKVARGTLRELRFPQGQITNEGLSSRVLSVTSRHDLTAFATAEQLADPEHPITRLQSEASRLLNAAMLVVESPVPPQDALTEIIRTGPKLDVAIRDAQAFIEASGLAEPAEMDIVNGLLQRLKANNEKFVRYSEGECRHPSKDIPWVERSAMSRSIG